jgi:hypothetical protein
MLGMAGPTAELGMSVQFCIATPLSASSMVVQSNIVFHFVALGMHTVLMVSIKCPLLRLLILTPCGLAVEFSLDHGHIGFYLMFPLDCLLCD